MTPATTQSVDLPPEIVDRVEDRLSRTEFDSASEYITFVIEEVLASVETDDAVDDTVDEQEVEDRLKSLGYLED
ncbi:hypothetical protein [Halococcoides cellulosivorans]|uniref:CopG family transcriptional regulator n=1 Tax=Halococcoides cellulosivorans TaxID=1679096 RepID=A0A2R4X2Z5_9EURY|nr:hypothetical protein [Halococcoides cellulosivorans]AWB28176.1 hypothetical protein HARCEL1_10895 [Halococcoides cellulosivorans]